MKTLVSAAEASRLDAEVAASCRLPPLILMENAAVRLWAAVEHVLPGPAAEDGAAPGAARSACLIAALAGPGNNGGDALAVLRQARFAGWSRLAAILLADRQGELAEIQRASLEAMGVELVYWRENPGRAKTLLAESSLVVDGVTGTGLKGVLRGPAAELVQAANDSGRPLFAIDLPSGLGDGYEAGGLVVAARWTASIEPRKACLYFPAARRAVGEILAIEGVFPLDALPASRVLLLEEGDLPALCPRPPADAHKGSRGRLAVLAGSPGMMGAAGLAVAAATAASAGLITLHADDEVYPALAAGKLPETLAAAIIKRLPAGAEDLAELRADAILVGPGWGRSPVKARLLEAVLESGVPAVLDADALRLVAPILSSGLRPRASLVLTPHPGEFEALSGLPADAILANPAAQLSRLAAEWRAVIVLKSHVTWIAAPDGRLAVWDGLEPSLATAGSGDVLAGLAAGFLAGLVDSGRAETGQVGTEAAWRAAQAAVIAHGMAGRRARASRGWYAAGALVEEAARLILPP